MGQPISRIVVNPRIQLPSLNQNLSTMPENNKLGKKPMALLNVIAALKINFDEDEVDKKKAAGMAEINGGSTQRNAFADLKKRGWIEYKVCA